MIAAASFGLSILYEWLVNLFYFNSSISDDISVDSTRKDDCYAYIGISKL